MPNETIDKERKLYIRRHMSLNDISQSASFLKKLRQTDDNELRLALETAAVVSYCRPFSGNDKHLEATKRPDLDFTDKEQEIHDNILKLRRKVYAHTDMEPRDPFFDWNFAEVVPVGHYLNPFHDFEKLVDDFDYLCKSVLKKLIKKQLEFQNKYS